jgi:DNA-binding NarL/FixJ family response regulator
VTTASAVRVVLVDDHPVVREGLRSMLLGASVEVVGEAGTGADAVRVALALGPDVVLLDMQLPDMDGVAVVLALKRAAPTIAVLVLSMHDDPALVRRALDAGASGYLLKGAGRQRLLDAITTVRSGEQAMDPSLRPTTASASDEPLTAVERAVLRSLGDGLTNREIAERMSWSVGTAKKYVQRIFERLEVSDRAQAVARAMRRGWLD